MDNWGECGYPWWFFVICAVPFLIAGVFFFKYKDMFFHKDTKDVEAGDSATE